MLILVASLRLCLSSHVTRVPESLHPPIQGVYALPDALPFLCPSPKSLHDERKVDFIHQQHFLLALNHTACGSYVTSRGRVEVNRRQRPKKAPVACLQIIELCAPRNVGVIRGFEIRTSSQERVGFPSHQVDTSCTVCCLMRVIQETNSLGSFLLLPRGTPFCSRRWRGHV